MKKLTLLVIVAFAFCMAAAVAQTTPDASQGTQSSPGVGQPNQPSTQQQPGTVQPGMSQPDQTAPASQPEQNAPSQKTEKAERKLRGCVQSQGGQYVLESKKGKAIPLTGQDVSAHVGHEVSVKGNWESAGMSPSSSSTGNAAGSEKTFNVTSVDMISDTCSVKGKGSSGNMGTGTGTGTGTGAGTGTGPSNPASNTPPQ
jgi:hypothetical protein